MSPLSIAKQSLRMLWERKYLLFFGFFLGTGGGAGFRLGEGGKALPGWAVWLLVGASVLGVAALVMHVISEAALIEAARRGREGESLRIGGGMRVGARHFGRVLAIKALMVVAMTLSAAVMATPVVLVLLELVPGPAALLVVPLVLAGVPWLLTLYFIQVYALRFAVLDGRGALAAIREGKGFLHGRVADSLKLLLVAAAGQVGGSLAGGVAAIPAFIVGVSVYFAAGLLPAIVAGGVLLLPVAVLVAGAIGAFGSTVWTLGFLQSRAEAG